MLVTLKKLLSQTIEGVMDPSRLTLNRPLSKEGDSLTLALCFNRIGPHTETTFSYDLKKLRVVALTNTSIREMLNVFYPQSSNKQFPEKPYILEFIALHRDTHTNEIKRRVKILNLVKNYLIDYDLLTTEGDFKRAMGIVLNTEVSPKKLEAVAHVILPKFRSKSTSFSEPYRNSASAMQWLVTIVEFSSLDNTTLLDRLETIKEIAQKVLLQYFNIRWLIASGNDPRTVIEKLRQQQTHFPLPEGESPLFEELSGEDTVDEYATRVKAIRDGINKQKHNLFYTPSDGGSKEEASGPFFISLRTNLISSPIPTAQIDDWIDMYFQAHKPLMACNLTEEEATQLLDDERPLLSAASCDESSFDGLRRVSTLVSYFREMRVDFNAQKQGIMRKIRQSCIAFIARGERVNSVLDLPLYRRLRSEDSPLAKVPKEQFDNYYLQLSQKQLKQLQWLENYGVHHWLSPKVIMGMTLAKFEVLNLMAHSDFKRDEHRFQLEFILWLFAKDMVQDDHNKDYQLASHITQLNSDIFNNVLDHLGIPDEQVARMPPPETSPDLKSPSEHRMMVESLSRSLIDMIKGIMRHYQTRAEGPVAGSEGHPQQTDVTAKRDYFLLKLKQFLISNEQETRYLGQHPWDMLVNTRLKSSAMLVMYAFNTFVREETQRPHSYYCFQWLTGGIPGPVNPRSDSRHYYVAMPKTVTQGSSQLFDPYRRVPIMGAVRLGRAIPERYLAPIRHRCSEDPIALCVLQEGVEFYEYARTEPTDRRAAFSPDYGIDMCAATVQKFIRLRKPFRKEDIQNFSRLLDDKTDASRFKSFCMDYNKALTESDELDLDPDLYEQFKGLKFAPILDVLDQMDDKYCEAEDKKMAVAIEQTARMLCHLIPEDRSRLRSYFNSRQKILSRHLINAPQSDIRRCFNLKPEDVLAYHVPNPIVYYFETLCNPMPPEVFNYVMALIIEHIQNTPTSERKQSILIQQTRAYLLKLNFAAFLRLDRVKREAYLIEGKEMGTLFEWDQMDCTKKIWAKLQSPGGSQAILTEETDHFLAALEKDEPGQFGYHVTVVYEAHKTLSKLKMDIILSGLAISVFNDGVSKTDEEATGVGINVFLCEARSYESALRIQMAKSGWEIDKDHLARDIRSIFLSEEIDPLEVDEMVNAIINRRPKLPSFTKLSLKLQQKLDEILTRIQMGSPSSLESSAPDLMEKYKRHLSDLVQRWGSFFESMEIEEESPSQSGARRYKPLPKTLLVTLLYDLERFGYSTEDCRKIARKLTEGKLNTSEFQLLFSRFKELSRYLCSTHPREEYSPTPPRAACYRLRFYLKVMTEGLKDPQKDLYWKKLLDVKPYCIATDLWQLKSLGLLVGCEALSVDELMEVIQNPVEHPFDVQALKTDLENLIDPENPPTTEDVEEEMRLLSETYEDIATPDFPTFLLVPAMHHGIQLYQDLVHEFLAVMPIVNREISRLLRLSQSPYLDQYLRFVLEMLQWIVGNQVFSVDNKRYFIQSHGQPGTPKAINAGQLLGEMTCRDVIIHAKEIIETIMANPKDPSLPEKIHNLISIWQTPTLKVVKPKREYPAKITSRPRAHTHMGEATKPHTYLLTERRKRTTSTSVVTRLPQGTVIE